MKRNLYRRELLYFCSDEQTTSRRETAWKPSLCSAEADNRLYGPLLSRRSSRVCHTWWYWRRYIPLALAVMNNIMRDVILGMIPFSVGDVIDVFHKSNKKNMALIDGFVEGNEEVVSTVKRKAAVSAAVFALLCVLLYVMIRIVIWAGQQVISLF